MSVDLERPSVLRPTPLNVAAFLPHACDQLLAPFHVTTKLVVVEDYVSKQDEKGKKAKRDKEAPINQVTSTQRPFETKESEISVLGTNIYDENEVVVTTVCDTTGRLIELIFYRCTQIPRLLMKIIALCIPYQLLLSKITIRWGPLDGLVLYEIAKILPQSYITDICLDDSPVLQRNYYLLLDRQTPLKNLSLARCNLDDEDCIAIAMRLRYPEPAARSLAVLCLASNVISDVGAAALGEALRSNRTLRHLNLCGNRISDDGATKILGSLGKFHLTVEEIMSKRKRLFEHIKLKEMTYTKCYNDLIVATVEKPVDDKISTKRKLTNRSKRSSTVTLALTPKSNTQSSLALRAEAMAVEILGPLVEPFSTEHTESFNKLVFSRGNTILTYLNLAYNNLTYESVLLLVDVVRYQIELTEKMGPGLLRVVLDSNLIPKTCELMSALDELFQRALGAVETPKNSPRRTERAKSKSLR